MMEPMMPHVAVSFILRMDTSNALLPELKSVNKTINDKKQKAIVCSFVLKAHSLSKGDMAMTNIVPAKADTSNIRL